MSERIDQDPNINTPDANDVATEAFRVPNTAQQPRTYTETPLREAVGVHFAASEEERDSEGSYFPDHIPSHVIANPDHAAAREVVPSPDNQKKSYLKRGLAILAGAAVLGGGGILVGKALGKNEAYENVLADQPSTSTMANTDNGAYEKSPVKLTAENATSNQFLNQDPEYPYDYTRAEQLDYAGVELNTDMQSTAERMRDQIGRQYPIFTGEDGVTTRTLAKPSLDNTPQQIWDQITVGTFQAWEAAQGGNMNIAKKLAAGVADPERREYTDQLETFSNTDALSVIPEGVAWNEQPVITQGEYEDISASQNTPLIEFNVNIGGNGSGNRIKAVLRFEQGTQPDSARWVLVTTHKA